MHNIKKLLVNYKLIKPESLEEMFLNYRDENNPWIIRKEALERMLNGEEFARILIHIAKRRGYKALKKSEELSDTEDQKKDDEGKMLQGISQTKRLLQEKGYLTVGEMFAKDENYSEAKRNKKDIYKNSIPRDLLESEIKIIFEKQRELNNPYALQDLEQRYLEIFAFQLDTGSVEKMVGKCTFEKEELRAPKQAYTAELFVALGKINNLVIVCNDGKTPDRFLKEEERKLVLQECKSKQKVTYANVRKALHLQKEFYTFKGVNPQKGKTMDDAEKATFIEMKGYYAIAKAVKDKCGAETWDLLKDHDNDLDEIANAITLEKNDDAIANRLQTYGLPISVIDAVISISMKKFIHISLKALYRILPEMMEGHKYHIACENAGYNQL